MRIGELDVLRAYGVIAVVLLHYLLIAAFQTPFSFRIIQAVDLATGVDLFFAISGFVISKSLYRLWLNIDQRPFHLAYKQFIARRFWRLWPALAFWVSACFTVSALLHASNFPPRIPVAFTRWLAGLFYASNFLEASQGETVFGYLWSLAMEWQFYVIFPGALFLIKGNASRISAIIGLLVLGIFWRFYPPAWWLFRFDALLAGILAYMALDIKKFRIRSSWMAWGPSAAIVTAALLTAIVFNWPLLPPYLLQTVRSLLCGVLVYLAGHGEGYVSGFGALRAFQSIGLRSYSIYLAHLPIVLAITSYLEILVSPRQIDFVQWWPLLMLVAFILLVLCSEASYRVLEGFHQRNSEPDQVVSPPRGGSSFRA